MADFSLSIVTPSGVFYNGMAQSIIARTTSGDIGVLAGHANYVAPLAIGALTINNGEHKVAAVGGGMIKILNGDVTILTNTCEWSDEIDIERARRAAERARDYIEHQTELHTEEVANIKLQRAINRIEIAGRR